MSTVPSVGAAGSAGATATTSSGSNATLGTDSFLKLMVAELKNQDPMNPASSTEFLAQTAQFTSVEKLTQLVQQYTDMISAQKVTEATAMIGHPIGYTDTNGAAAQGIVSSIRLLASGPVLRVGTTDVPLASVTNVG